MMDLRTDILTDTFDPARLCFSERCYPAAVDKLSIHFGVSRHLFKRASSEEDKHEATDVIFLRPDDNNFTFAFRFRRARQYEKYKGDITFRSENKEHHTEVDKVLAGKVMFCFYAYGHEEGRIFGWVLIDLRVLRLHWDDIRKEHLFNHDGELTGFLALKLKDLYQIPSIILGCAPEIRRLLS